MTEQEKIDEITQDMYGAEGSDIYICRNGCSKACGVFKYEDRTVPAGYRKATEVIDEFVERLKNQFDSNGNLNTAMFGWTTSEIKMLIDLSSKDFINELAAEMRQEVKK